jgi:hypothetical protein
MAAMKPPNGMVAQHFEDRSMDTVNELESIHMGVGKLVGAVRHVWAGGAAATDDVTVPGVAATDVIVATLNARNSTQTLILAERQAADTVRVTLSANGQDDTCIISVLVFRPAA